MILEERRVTLTKGDGREPYSVRLVIDITDGKPQTSAIYICSGQEGLVELSISSAILLNHQIVEAIQEHDRLMLEYLHPQEKD